MAYPGAIAEIAFVVKELEPAGASVQPIIDGQRLSTWVGPGTCGMWPAGLARILLPEVGERRRQVLRCSCGDTGCDYATVEIEALAAEIVWRDFVARTPQRRTPDEVRFGRDAYVEALKRLPPEAWGDDATQPRFRPPGPPFLFVMTNVGRPGDAAKVYAAPFEALDQQDAERQAALIADRYHLHAGEWAVWRLGTEFWPVEQLDGWQVHVEPEGDPEA